MQSLNLGPNALWARSSTKSEIIPTTREGPAPHALQLLEVLLNLRRELNRLLIQISKLDVNIAHRLFEVEVLITSGGATPT